MGEKFRFCLILRQLKKIETAPAGLFAIYVLNNKMK